MTEVAVIDENKTPKAPISAGGKLAAFVPSNLDEAWRLAGALASSGMAPKSYGQDQNKIMVGMMAGAEVGLAPFQSLQSIAVIGNNPSLWGDGALALVQASGLLEDMEETDNGSVATCTLRRSGRPTAIVRSFSMDDAKRAGLAGKAGPWTQYPQRMRQMRARAFAMRDGFADVLKGLNIAEEVRDYAAFSGEELQANTPRLTVADLQSQADIGSSEQRSAMPEPNYGNRTAGEIADDEAASTEQPTNDSAGETTTLESAKSEIDSAEIIPDVNSRVSILAPLLNEDDANELRSYAMERIEALKGGK